MFTFLSLLFMVVVFAAANRVRGVDLPIPGHSLYYMAPFLGLVTFLMSGSLAYGTVIFASYMIWGLAPHGEWFDHNRLPPETDRVYESSYTQAFADFINKISGGNDMVAMFFRHSLIGLGLLGYMLITGASPWILLLTFPVAAIMVTIHETSIKTYGHTGNFQSELYNGAFLGFLVWLGMLGVMYV